MNLLLDTHIFIWVASEADKVAEPVRQAVRNPENRLFLSVASVWEMQIKVQIGRLTLPLPIKELVAVQQALNDIEIVPLLIHHIWTLDKLPLYHKDPFDRILIAQTIAEEWTLVTADDIFTHYPVQLLA
jgi:PIN domain nuclease of toxin-antitoxin system